MLIIVKRKRLLIYVCVLLMSMTMPFLLRGASQIAYVAIIIDDFGNGTRDTKNFIALEKKFTGAIMPSREFSEKDCTDLLAAHKDVILHMPMEPKTGRSSWLGKNALTSGLSNEQVEHNIKDSLTQLPGAIGMNNHMGSKIMESEKFLDIIFRICSEQNLIFIDSKTTPKSKAKVFAEKYHVTFFERDVFLEDKGRDITNVKRNLNKAVDIAKKRGFVIAIGHVGGAGGKSTAQAINDFDDPNVKFITVSELKSLFAFQK